MEWMPHFSRTDLNDVRYQSAGSWRFSKSRDENRLTNIELLDPNEARGLLIQERLSQTSATTVSQQRSVDRDSTVVRTHQVIAPMLDVWIGSRSLAGETAPITWKSSIYSSGWYSRSATVNFYGEQRSQEVAVDGRILEELCGDVDLQEGKWSSRFLQGLLEERIAFPRRTLEDNAHLSSLKGEACKHRVVPVSLPVFPL
jgi:hypothetical protein